MGHWMRQLLATLCVASSLALVALGGSDLTRQVLPSNPEIWQTPQKSWDPMMRRTRNWMAYKIIFYSTFLPRLWSPAALPPRLLRHKATKLTWSLLRNLHLPV
jgi:hypothetical protein